MHISQFKQSKYLAKEDLPEGGAIVTINSVTLETIDVETGEQKAVMTFYENLKPMIVNFTNLDLASHALGDPETDNWPGKQVVLWNDQSVSYAGRRTGGIRIRPAAAPQQPVPVAPPQQIAQPPAPPPQSAAEGFSRVTREPTADGS